jgi:hypothetical protein
MDAAYVNAARHLRGVCRPPSQAAGLFAPSITIGGPNKNRKLPLFGENSAAIELPAPLRYTGNGSPRGNPERNQLSPVSRRLLARFSKNRYISGT